MLISRDDPRFWDVRTRERRIRRGEISLREVEEYLQSLPDVSDKATISVPLEEPDERARERRPQKPIIRATPPPPPAEPKEGLPAREDPDEEGDEDIDDTPSGA
ncbi:MAG: hypothetical protein RMK29_07795 [Myxococcales bacterium]|nr:hypothetical protein [Myxococcota bacterium]MDW8281596.1 hypothetical protein [Myxococcales bacterium]